MARGLKSETHFIQTIIIILKICAIKLMMIVVNTRNWVLLKVFVKVVFFVKCRSDNRRG